MQRALGTNVSPPARPPCPGPAKPGPGQEAGLGGVSAAAGIVLWREGSERSGVGPLRWRLLMGAVGGRGIGREYRAKVGVRARAV